MKIEFIEEEKEALESAIQLASEVIDGLPSVDKVSLEDKDGIQEARSFVEAAIMLGASETDLNLSKLKLLEESIKQFELEKEISEAKEIAIQAIIEAKIAVFDNSQVEVINEQVKLVPTIVDNVASIDDSD